MTAPARPGPVAPPAPPTSGSLGATLLWALVVAIVAIGLAPLGLTAIYVVGGLVAVGVVAYALRGDLREPVLRGVRRILPASPPSGASSSPRPTVRAIVPLAATGACAAALAWVVAGRGAKAAVAVVALVVGGALLALLWPLVVDLVTGPPGTPRRRARAQARPRSQAPSSRPRRPARTASRSSALVGAGVVGAAAAGIAWLAASLGTKGLVAVVGAVVVAGLFTFVRDRSVFFTFVAVCSLTLVLHKSFGPQDLQLSGGAIAVYVTTFDVMIVLLYGLWIREGTFRSDLRAALREPVLWFPLVGALLLLPSVLVAPTPLLSAAELVRMAWMYLLYVYVAVRVRTRRHIWAILGGLVVFVAVELVVVVLQWRTGGVLGLSFLGVPTELGDRVTDAGVLGRPFGTIIHPVFLAASLGAVAMVALAFAIGLRRSLAKLTAIVVVPACLACMWISDTRASVVAAAMAGVVVVGAGIARGRLAWVTIGRIAGGAIVLALVFFPVVSEKFVNSFRTGHFLTEVESRLELNDIAGTIIRDHPVLGVGLNNFEVVLPRYEAHPVIFFGHPVHNLYLLVLAETGIVGLLGLLLVGIGLYDVAIRLARSPDRLLGTLGIGVAAAMGFLMLEELLGFSLRQDIPLALYWLLAGLAVAGTRMSGLAWPALRPGGTRAAPRRARRVPRRVPVAAAPAVPSRAKVRLAVRHRFVAIVVATGFLATGFPDAGVPVALASPLGAAVPAAPGLVFSAIDRTSGVQGIFAADVAGGDVHRITPADGRFYSWPRWAFGNTRIVYTVRSGPPGSPEAIALMDPDGARVQVVQQFEYRVSQPVIEPSGRTVVYTATPPWFPKVAVFRMDLATGESTNLTAKTVPIGGFDSDPSLTPTADGVVFAWNESNQGATISEIGPDGTNRRRITHDSWFNTDPSVSPDGTQIVLSSYRGDGTPSAGAAEDISSVKPGDWKVVTVPRTGGAETALTTGADCTVRPVEQPCSVAEMSGFVPRFTPDGASVSFTGALDSTRTCICALGLDGTNAREIVASSALAIDWYDWPQAAGAQTSTGQLGARARTSRLLVVTARPDGTRFLLSATADLMHRTEIPLPDGLQPYEARWGADGQTIVFTAKVATGPPRAPHPAAPAGQSRRAHVSLDDLDPVATGLRQGRLADQEADLAGRQVFVRRPDGSVRQVTDPWTEDWRDGLAPGDARASTNPVLTPDGRYVIVTNTSTTTGESFLLRIDLTTGAVLNLTNGSAGAVPTDDSEPAVSPDGTQVAFAWTDGTVRGVYVMDTATGTHVRAIGTGTQATSMPAWAPDGRSLAYVSDRATGSVVVRAALSAALATGPETAVSPPASSAWRPVVAPEGDRIVYLAVSGNVLGLYGAPMRDGATSPDAALVQPDPLHNIFDVDWR